MKRINKPTFIIAILVCASLGMVFLILRSNSQGKSGHVVIDNFSDCSKNATSGRADDVSTGLYKLVKSANDYNKLTTSNSYQATIRKGSCQNTSNTATDNTSGKQQTVQTSTIIVDIPSAKQSWKITYDWIAKGAGKVNIDVGTIQPSCLPNDQLLYGDFKCENILSLATYGTDKPDAILQYMPYIGAGFHMEYDADTKTVTVFFDPPPGTTNVAVFVQSTKDVIPYWFQKRGLDQSKYKVLYSSDIDAHESDDN